MADNVKKTVVQIDWDQSSAKRVEGGTSRVKQGIEEVKKIAQALGRDLGITDKRLAKYGKTAEDAGKRIDNLANEIDDTDEAAKRLDKTAKQLDKTLASSDGARQLEKDMRAARDAAGEFGDVATRGRDVAGLLPVVAGAGGQQIERLAIGGADILDAVEGAKLLRLEAPKLAAQLGFAQLSAVQLGLGIGVIGVASIAAIAAMKLIGDASKDAQQSAQAQIEIQRQLSDLQIANLTTKEIEAEKQAIEELNTIRRAERTALKESRRELFLSLNDLEKYGEATGLANQGIDDYTTRIDELTKEVDSSAAVFVELDNALGSATAATNDAIAAEKELASERETEVSKRIKVVQRDLKLESDAANRAATFTQDQLDAKKDEVAVAIALENATLEKLRADLERGKIDGQIADDAIAASEVRAFVLRTEQELLDTVVTEGVEAREKEAGAIGLLNSVLEITGDAAESAADALEESFKSIAKGAQTVAGGVKKDADKAQDFADKTAETAAKRDLKLTQDAEKAALDRVNKLADHYTDMAQLDLDYFEERGGILQDTQADLGEVRSESLEAQRDFNKESIRDTEDHLDKIAQIQRNAQRSIRSASLRLDAVAIYEAGQAREEELRAENEQYNKDQERRDEDFQAQQDQYQKERQERQLEGQQDLEDLRQQHQRARAEKEADFNESQRRENQQRQLQLQHQQQQWSLEDQQRRDQFMRVETANTTHQQRLGEIMLAGMETVELEFAAGIKRMAITPVILGGTKTATSGSVATPLPRGNLRAFGNGGNPPLFQDVIVGDRGPEIARFNSPATIFPNGSAPRGGGSVSIAEGAFQFTIPGGGNAAATGREIMAQVRPAMIELFNEISGE